MKKANGDRSQLHGELNGDVAADMVAEDDPIYPAHRFGNPCWPTLHNIYRRAKLPHRSKNGQRVFL